MNLKEALFVLRNNDYLVEFLQDTKMFNTDIIIKRINKDLNLNFVRVAGNTSSPVYITRNPVSKEIRKKIEKIANIYNMHTWICDDWKNYSSRIKLPLPNVCISFHTSSSNDPLRIYNPRNNVRLFVHGSDISPEIILKIGLRPKAGKNGEHENWANVEGVEKRIYMSSIEKWEGITDESSTEELADRILKDYDNGYGKYWYLIKLPKHFQIRNDPEGVNDEEYRDEDLDWTYTLHSIPPQFLLFIAGEDDDYPKATKEDIIEFITKR